MTGNVLCGLCDSLAGECPGANTSRRSALRVEKYVKHGGRNRVSDVPALLQRSSVLEFLWYNIWLCSSVGTLWDTLGDFH